MTFVCRLSRYIEAFLHWRKPKKSRLIYLRLRWLHNKKPTKLVHNQGETYGSWSRIMKSDGHTAFGTMTGGEDQDMWALCTPAWTLRRTTMHGNKFKERLGTRAAIEAVGIQEWWWRLGPTWPRWPRSWHLKPRHEVRWAWKGSIEVLQNRNHAVGVLCLRNVLETTNPNDYQDLLRQRGSEKYQRGRKVSRSDKTDRHQVSQDSSVDRRRYHRRRNSSRKQDYCGHRNQAVAQDAFT